MIVLVLKLLRASTSYYRKRNETVAEKLDFGGSVPRDVEQTYLGIEPFGTPLVSGGGKAASFFFQCSSSEDLPEFGTSESQVS
jgi:hypothetical protein